MSPGASHRLAEVKLFPAVLTVLQQMRWFVSGSSTSVQSLVRKAGTLLEYPSITSELGESCIAPECPRYTNPIALGAPASPRVRPTENEAPNFIPGQRKVGSPGVTSAVPLALLKTQHNAMASPAPENNAQNENAPQPISQSPE